MSIPASLRTTFENLSTQSDDSFDMIEAALAVSKLLKPSGKIEQAQTKLTQLTERLNDTAHHLTNAHALQKVMSQEERFHGDEDAFDDLDHMNLFCVLENKCATALTLSLLYVHCAQMCGWSAHVLNFPSYCLIAIDEGNKRVIIDPFNGCVELDAYNLRQFLKVIGGAEAELHPQFYEAISAKTVAIRHINAIKGHFLRCQQLEQALKILQTLTLLEPTSDAFWRETGLLQARIGQTEAATQALKTSLKYTRDINAIRHTENILADLDKP